MTEEQKAQILGLVKADLQKLNPPKNDLEYIEALISASIQDIQTEGVVLDLTDSQHVILVVQYTSWMYRKRALNDNAMPRQLRWRLNNAVLSEKNIDARNKVGE